MWLLLLLLFFQSPVERNILEIENSRAEDVSVLLAALKNPDPHLQQLAVRALGRLERAAYREAVIPLLRSPNAEVRKEAVNALGQMRASYDFITLLKEEKDGAVRGVIYETIGRMQPVGQGTETLLVSGLTDKDKTARIGAAKGIESFFRLNNRTLKPSAETIKALRQALRDNEAAMLRELVLLTLNAAGDKDADTFAVALRDANPQVRRLAVLGSRQWIDDPSPMVRYEALRVAGNCERASKALNDENEHVALAAVDWLGANNCAAGAIEQLVDSGKTWRMRAHALVSLAKVAPDSARRRLPKFASDSIWQVRVYAANAAKILKDEETLAKLMKDANPNVVEAAINSAADALRALESNHYGLLFTAARRLRGAPELQQALPQLIATLQRLTRDNHATSRDPRMQLLERLREVWEPRVEPVMKSLLADIDPAIAARAAAIISEKTGAKVEPQTKRYVSEPLPSEKIIRELQGATARIKMKDLGTFTLELLPEEAPVTVAIFAQLAEKSYYNGLTFHRIVPNFVIQGGSPGADEYDGIWPFMRDELGLLSHLRGTLGISTRGRDTGDAQIFVNLVDNFRLDHDYTVFARVIEGLDIVDKVQEGDIIESIQIQRRPQR